MRQAVLVGPRRFELREAPTPAIGPGDVLVRVRACGVCASELHAWADGEDAPLALGHEVAGVVITPGERVNGFRAGDRVTGLFHRGFSDLVVAPADRVVPVPDAMPLEHAFGEPLACAVSAARRTTVELGDRVAVVGVGFMGLLILQLLRLKGPAHILAIDLRTDALDAAKRLGADAVARPEEVGDGLKATLAARTAESGGFDVVVEATGTPDGLTLAGELAKAHGMLSILGYHQGGPRVVDMKLWNYKALDVLNAHERRVEMRIDGMKRGLALAAAGRLDLASLLTHRFGLDAVGHAFDALEAKPPRFIKSVVTFGEDA